MLILGSSVLLIFNIGGLKTEEIEKSRVREFHVKINTILYRFRWEFKKKPTNSVLTSMDLSDPELLK